MAKLRGSINARPNGRYTVVTEPTWDPKAGMHRRTSLGTYDTRDEAEGVLLGYNHETRIGVFALSEVELRRVRLDEYLTEWLNLIRQEQEVGDIELLTLRDYESVVRNDSVSPEHAALTKNTTKHSPSARVGDLILLPASRRSSPGARGHRPESTAKVAERMNERGAGHGATVSGDGQAPTARWCTPRVMPGD